MKTKLLFNLIFILAWPLILASCQNDDEIPVVDNKKFIVDKIYDYNNDLIAEYFYDDENKLIKKSVTEHLGESYLSEWAAYSHEFEYQNGLVSKIIHKDISYNIFNYETYIYYNSKEEIIKTEMYMNGHQISSDSEYQYKDKHLISTIRYTYETIEYSDLIVYDNSGNVIEYILESPETDLIGNPIPGTKITTVRQFNYDNHLKPAFNLDYLFIYEPLPFLEEGDLQRQLSANNMTEVIGGTKWIYTINEFGLPSIIEVRWRDIETTIPMLLRIQYKEID